MTVVPRALERAPDALHRRDRYDVWDAALESSAELIPHVVNGGACRREVEQLAALDERDREAP